MPPSSMAVFVPGMGVPIGRARVISGVLPRGGSKALAFEAMVDGRGEGKEVPAWVAFALPPVPSGGPNAAALSVATGEGVRGEKAGLGGVGLGPRGGWGVACGGRWDWVLGRPEAPAGRMTVTAPMPCSCLTRACAWA